MNRTAIQDSRFEIQEQGALSRPSLREVGLALVEVVVTVVAVVVLICVLSIGAERSRRLARMGDDMAHLRQLATAGASYSAGNGDKFWTFSWRMGPAPIPPGDPNGSGLFNAANDLTAAANQLVYLLRTVGERPLMPTIPAFIPHVGYSHVVLAAEGHMKLPARTVVSSENRHRLLWANDPLGYDQGLYSPNLGTSVSPSVNWRHPYSADFRPPTCFFDLSPVGLRISQSGSTSTYLVPGNSVQGQALMSSVAFPAHKFMAGDYIARHMGSRQPYCVGGEARLPMLMADGSVEVRAAAESNPGCDPNTGQQVSLAYTPGPIDPPGVSEVMPGRFLWTRQRLGGRDFRGPDVPGF